MHWVDIFLDKPHPTMEKINVQSKGVHKLFSNLKTHKATGPDSIPAYVLKSAADQLAPILTRLYQYSLDCGEIPPDWKNAFVVPIFKKAEKHVPSNYRPVSLTSIACKVLEHIVHSSVMGHFDKNQILIDKQHGFRARRSCETQLISTIQEIAHNMMRTDLGPNTLKSIQIHYNYFDLSMITITLQSQDL